MHVLALDSDQGQMNGAQRWEGKVQKLESRKKQKSNIKATASWYIGDDERKVTTGAERLERLEHSQPAGEEGGSGRESGSGGGGGNITHKTIHIKQSTLLSSIDEWVSGSGSSTSDIDSKPSRGDAPQLQDQHIYGGGHRDGTNGEEPIPVLIVALHACGSLTPSTIRAFLSAHREHARQRKRQHEHERGISISGEVPGGLRREDNKGDAGWIPAGLVLVGCCYNLLELGGRSHNDTLFLFRFTP
jgi:hypothetical protein